MRRILAGACACLLIAAVPSDAHRSTTSRVHNARHIAESVWGVGKCDVGTMRVPIVRRAGGIRNRHGQLTGFAGLFNYTLTPDGGFVRCSIEIDGREPIGTEYLCRLIAHETGHAAGRDHSPDAADIMYAYSLPYWEPCAYGAASTRSTRPLPPPLVAEPVAPAAEPTPTAEALPVTVLLLHGGGWRSGSPDGMEPQARDLRAHGINARSIAYELGSVARALESVRQAVARETPPIVLYGISAGGTLAAALAATGEVAGAINVSGPTDFKHWWTPSGLEIKHRLRMSPAEQRAVSPLWRLNGRQTSQLLQCGLADPLVDYISQCLRYADAARRGNPDTTLQQTVSHGPALDDHARVRAWIQARWPR